MSERLQLDLRSRLNDFFRSQARRISPENPVRRFGARAWECLLALMGGHVCLEIQGHVVRLESRFRSFSRDYERQTLGVMMRLLQPGDVFWDIGANFGICTLLAAQRTGPTGHVVSWEASPAAFQVLCRHVGLNRLSDRVQTVRGAINDGTSRWVDFLVDQGDILATTNRIKVMANADLASIRTEAGSLDDWSVRLPRQPALIKIDIEGAEVLALNGAKRLMSEPTGTRPILIVAVHPQFLPEYGCRPEDIERIAGERGYTPLGVDGRPCRPVEYAEYVLAPTESLARVQA